MAFRYRHLEAVEKNAGLLGILIAIMVSLGGLAEITPLFMRAHAVGPAPGVEPYDALRLAGKDIYVREGCYLCHTQMIRSLRAETQRYGHYSTADESIYDRPHQWGSKRTGPDIARVGGKYTDEWHRVHLRDPRSVVPDSNMPAYPWLSQQLVDPDAITQRMHVLRLLGDPYTDADIAAAGEAVRTHTEMEALIAYLQGLGVTNPPDSSRTAVPSTGGASAAATPAAVAP